MAELREELPPLEPEEAQREVLPVVPEVVREGHGRQAERDAPDMGMAERAHILLAEAAAVLTGTEETVLLPVQALRLDHSAAAVEALRIQA